MEKKAPMKETENPKKPESINDLIKLTDKENAKPEDLQRLRKRLDDNSALVEINEVGRQALNRVINTTTQSELVQELSKGKSQPNESFRLRIRERNG